MKRLASTLFGSLLFVSATFGQSAIEECANYLTAGDYRRAILAGQRAVRMFPNSVEANFCLGASYLQVGELKLAVEYLKRAESLTSDKNHLSAIYNLLGQASYRMDDLDLALYYFSRQLVIDRELGNKEGEAGALGGIAVIHQKKGDYDKALDYYQQALSLVKDDENKATIYNNMASIYLSKKDYNKVIEYFQKAIELEERLGNYHGVAQTYLNLGDAYREVKNYELAEKYLTEGLRRVQRVGDKYWEANGYVSLGLLYKDKGDNKLARDYFTRAYNLYKSIGAQAYAEGVKKALLTLGTDPDKPQKAGKKSR